MLIPLSWFCFIIVTSVWAELILYFPPYAGEQRLWVWVGHWHRDHTKAGQVHVWQPGKWRHQLCHPGGASDPAAGEHPLFHTAPYCWEIKHDWCVFLFFFLPPARRERLPWSSKASTTRERQSAPGTHTQTHTKQMLLVSFPQTWIKVVVGWCKCCRRTGGEAPCWWEWGAITSCPPITFRCSTAQVSFASQPLSLSLSVGMQIEILFVVFFSAAKDKKSCGALSRTAQDTCLFPVDEKAVEYYFASDARSVFKQAPDSRGS